jgi:hypothetical protein
MALCQQLDETEQSLAFGNSQSFLADVTTVASTAVVFSASFFAIISLTLFYGEQIFFF